MSLRMNIVEKFSVGSLYQHEEARARGNISMNPFNLLDPVARLQIGPKARKQKKKPMNRSHLLHEPVMQ